VPQGVYPNRMIDSSYIKPRIVHWYNYLYDTKGYLHWALNQWSVPFLTFSPGDNWIVWPSKTRVFDSSLRYEAQKSSLEDCQLLFQLEAAQRRMAEQLGVKDFDAKALPKAAPPFEIIHQRPDEITSQRYAGLNGPMGRAEMAAQVINSALVSDTPGRIRTIRKAAAVLGDIDFGHLVLEG